MTDDIAIKAIANILRATNHFAEITINVEPSNIDAVPDITPQAWVYATSWASNWQADGTSGEDSTRTTNYEILLVTNPRDPAAETPSQQATYVQALLHNARLTNPDDPTDSTIAHYCDSGRYGSPRSRMWSTTVRGSFSYLTDQPNGQVYHPPSYFPPAYFGF